MKKKGLIITLSAVTVVIIAVFGTLLALGKLDFKQGDKDITVTVVYEDKHQNKVEISTDAQNLGDALYQAKLVTKEEHATGFYTVIDGVRADYAKDGAWWCVTKDGKMTDKGANDLPITDGDSFEITHTPA